MGRGFIIYIILYYIVISHSPSTSHSHLPSLSLSPSLTLSVHPDSLTETHKQDADNMTARGHVLAPGTLPPPPRVIGRVRLGASTLQVCGVRVCVCVLSGYVYAGCGVCVCACI